MDTSKDGESCEHVSIRQNLNVDLTSYVRLKIEIEKYERKLGVESELHKSVWNKINSKEQLIKELNEQIKNLKGEIDAHIIEESDISKSMKELKEKKEALEEQLLPKGKKINFCFIFKRINVDAHHIEEKDFVCIYLRPADIKLDNYLNMFVADSQNSRVQIFCHNNQTGITIAGDSATRLNDPRGIAFDSSMNTYIGDGGNGRVQNSGVTRILTVMGR